MIELDNSGEVNKADILNEKIINMSDKPKISFFKKLFKKN